MAFTVYPALTFADSYAQPSDPINGRRINVLFDTTNIYTRVADGYFTNSGLTSSIPVIVRVSGTTLESSTTEDFTFNTSGQVITSSLHFKTFSGVQVIQGNKIFSGDSYGAVEVQETLPLSQFDVAIDGYNTPFLQTTAYGNGIFVFTDAYGNSYNSGYGQYNFEYTAPFQIDLQTAPETIFIGNSEDLTHSADGILDEVKITSATATKTRTISLAGSYDISVDATRPVSGEPNIQTLALLHLDDNSRTIIDALRNPLDSANLPDNTLSTIVSLRNNRDAFINYVNSLNITGTIVDGSVDTRPLSAQLFDLVNALNTTTNSAAYYNLAGSYLPSEITVNPNFKYAAVFSGEVYSIEQPNLINNNAGTIELWLAPLANLLGDFKRRVYFDSINNSIIGQDGKLTSLTANVIVLPNNIMAQQINSITLYDNTNNTFDFNELASLSNNGTTITLQQPLPSNNTQIIINYIPVSTNNNRLTLFKDEYDNLVFSLLGNGVLYQVSHDISNWQKNEWHRVMVSWVANNPNNLNHLNMYVDGIEQTKIKYGQGFLFNTFTFNEEFQSNISTKIIPQTIQFNGDLDKLYIGSDFTGSQNGMCRMANLRVSFIERQPLVDARGYRIDADFDGGSTSATPEIQDSSTSYLEDFNPNNRYITNFAAIQDPTAGIHDLAINVRDYFGLVRGVDNGQIERLLREIIKIIVPAEARTVINIETE